MTDFNEVLIVAVRNSKILWDKTDKRYHNRLLVDREWRRIAKELGEPKEAVKGKWKNLLDTFNRELKKVHKSRSGEEANGPCRYKGTWCYFEEMYFLKRILTPRKTKGNLSSSQEKDINGDEFQSESQEDDESEANRCIEQEEYDKEEEELTHIEDVPKSAIRLKLSKRRRPTSLQNELENLEKSLPSSTSPKNPIKVSRKRKAGTPQYQHDCFEREMLQLEAKELDILRNTKDDDEDINFFKSLLPHVRQLSSINKLNFRSQVQNLLCQELCKLEPSNRASSSYCSPPSSDYNGIDQSSDPGHPEQYD
ncbi:transcription factor Adf-1-like [Harmonia axyridis]|uniref:transcription factor Adf-1-like n=1 Tax=Harmonia axyridis TaxID=115357 RepID=UPI001E279C5B|nr:transcription factor Adf-1-like [Harmonia axyridis]